MSTLVGGVLLNYQLVMSVLLSKVSNSHILKTTPPKDKLFAQVSSIEDYCQSFKSRPYLTSHVTRIEENLKLKSHLNPKIYVSVNRLRTSRCLMLHMGFLKLALL